MKPGLLCVLVCAATALPMTVSAQSEIAERARQARKVVVATVVDVHASFETNADGDQLIVSKVLVRAEETLKGGFEPALTVKLEGGTVGELTLNVSDMPAMKAGERAVLFLDQKAPGEYVPHDRGFGVMKLDAAARVRGTNLTLDEIRAAVRAVSR